MESGKIGIRLASGKSKRIWEGLVASVASRYNCSFGFYVHDKKVADVRIANGVVSTTKYTDDALYLPFGRVPDHRVTRKTIDLFYEEHCVPRHRSNIREYLDHFGLEAFDAFALCRITNGVMEGEPYRIEWYDA